jgi:DNA-binding MarR family transcriptional regulator
MKDNVPPSSRKLDLLSFTPFRLNRLAAEFSNALAADYGARFGLDIAEWRVLATLGPHAEPRSAHYVVRCTRTHKSRVSRAVAHLVERGLLARDHSDGDAREVRLRLTAQGRDVYGQLVPLMLAREDELLSALGPRDRRTLARILSSVETSLGLMTEAAR